MDSSTDKKTFLLDEPETGKHTHKSVARDSTVPCFYLDLTIVLLFAIDRGLCCASCWSSCLQSLALHLSEATFLGETRAGRKRPLRLQARMMRAEVQPERMPAWQCNRSDPLAALLLEDSCFRLRKYSDSLASFDEFPVVFSIPGPL